MARWIDARADQISQLLTAVEMMGWNDVIDAASSKLGIFTDAVVDSAEEAVPVVRFFLKLLKKLDEIKDPPKLAAIACVMAYRQAVSQAFTALERTDADTILKGLDRGLDTLREDPDIDYTRLTFAGLVTHAFTRQADALLRAEVLGEDHAFQTRLLNEVHSRLHQCFSGLLCNRGLLEKFEPLHRYLPMDREAVIRRATLRDHAQLQRRLYRRSRLLGQEPFALKDVYIPTECGELLWANVCGKSPARRRAAQQDNMTARSQPLDPFQEQNGGRKDLLSVVMKHIEDPNFRDGIVLQGAAGSGKSSFTLHLCDHLLESGLTPIRIRFRDLSFGPGTALLDALNDALSTEDLHDPEYETRQAYPVSHPREVLTAELLEEKIPFGRNQVQICPYVLILDGWDELSISARGAFRERLQQFLEDVRSQLLSRSNRRVRVVITGRPSANEGQASFMHNSTPLLTLRMLQVKHLSAFAKSTAQALREQPLGQDEGWLAWEVPTEEQLQPVMEQYSRELANEKALEDDLYLQRQSPSASASLAVLGLPLLAMLGLRLMGEWGGDLTELVRNPTRLYRNLVDLTCEKAGQPEGYPLDPSGRQRIAGDDLRALLQETAVAMSVTGQEAISRRELKARLMLEGGLELSHAVQGLQKDHLLSRLLVSYFFKGGHPDAGCEFVHKSFREYLFAEAIVESLKRYGRATGNLTGSLPPRTEEGEDFRRRDHRYALSRRLAHLLAPRWLTPEVVQHLRGLLEWEIIRKPGGGSDRSTPALVEDGWARVRDGLADLWAWWDDEVHLRPQPDQTSYVFQLKDGEPQLLRALTLWCAPKDSLPENKPRPVSIRPSALDAHLGDGLFRLCGWLHFFIARRDGWLDHPLETLWRNTAPNSRNSFQILSSISGSMWTLFAPSGADTTRFVSIKGRIESVEGRPFGPFPRGCDFDGASLREVNFRPDIPRLRALTLHIDAQHIGMSNVNLQGA
jgi:hypothetical protein